MFEESILVYATGANKCGTRNTKCEIEKNERSDKFLFSGVICSKSKQTQSRPCVKGGAEERGGGIVKMQKSP